MHLPKPAPRPPQAFRLRNATASRRPAAMIVPPPATTPARARRRSMPTRERGSMYRPATATGSSAPAKLRGPDRPSDRGVAMTDLSQRRIPSRAGVGLRLPHLAEVVATQPSAAWFEIHPENFLPNPHATELLVRIATKYP